MVKNMTGYVYVTLLLLVLIALGFVLSGGVILSKKTSLTIKGTDRYTVVDAGTLPSNPTLQISTLDFTPQVCGGGGLDIALVIDNSGSVSLYLAQMLIDINSFVDSFSGKSTLFSVTKFSDNAEILISDFTDDLEMVKIKIGSITSGGSTNWEDALVKAKETLNSGSNRLSVPDLVIFASDGNPNRSNSPGTAIETAVAEADAIKAGGARIITVGIGDNVITQNLQNISGPTPGVDGVVGTDVILTDFNNLSADLAKITVGICGP